MESKSSFTDVAGALVGTYAMFALIALGVSAAFDVSFFQAFMGLVAARLVLQRG